MSDDKDITVNGQVIGQIEKIEKEPKKPDSVYELPENLKGGVPIPGRIEGTIPLKQVQVNEYLVDVYLDTLAASLVKIADNICDLDQEGKNVCSPTADGSSSSLR